MPTAVEIKAELEALFKLYTEAFNRADRDQLLACFATPFAWITGELGLSKIVCEVERQNVFSRVMTELKARGWARSETDRFYTWALTENLGMTMADYTRYKAEFGP
jgi:hypothetical protein